MTRKIDRFLGRIGAGAGEHGYAAARLIDAPFNDLLVLVMRQCRAFAGGADGNEAVGALGDLPLDEVAERFLVDGTVLERGHQCGEGASKAGLGSHDTIRCALGYPGYGPLAHSRL